MQYRSLGDSGLSVSAICLGTMTWGEQNTEAEGHEQMDYALDQGVNYFDTAELYPVTPKEETQGRTEEIIGTWMKSRGTRDKIILASKLVSNSAPYFRDPDIKVFSKRDVQRGLDGSLKRLQTDYLDVYYLHWPARPTNNFGQLDYKHVPHDNSTPILETLEALADEIKAGRIRHIAVSNETPWGLMQFLHLADKHNLPKPVTIQNPYCLMNRSFEVGLSEMAIRENVGLSAYSPLAGGALTGKYIGGARPEGARVTLWPERYTRFIKPMAQKATEEYVALAHKHGLDPAQMALAWVNKQPFMTSNIIGATNMEQLKTNIASIDVVLSEEVIAGINDIHGRISNPAP